MRWVRLVMGLAFVSSMLCLMIVLMKRTGDEDEPGSGSLLFELRPDEPQESDVIFVGSRSR